MYFDSAENNISYKTNPCFENSRIIFKFAGGKKWEKKIY